MAADTHNLTRRINNDAQLDAWLASEEARGVKRLRLWHGGLTDRGARAIARFGGAIEALDLGDNDIGEDGALALAASPHLRSSLTSLGLYGNRVTDRGARALVEALPVTSLNLCGNQLSVDGLDAIASEAATRLVSLHLGFVDMGDAGADVLQRTQWPKLEQLNVRLNGITARGARGFFHAFRFPALRYLGLEDNPLGDAMVDALSGVPLGELLRINLGGVDLTEAGVRRWIDSHGEQIRKQCLLHDNRFDEAAVFPAEAARPWHHWRWLDGLYRTRLVVLHRRDEGPVTYTFECGRIHIGRSTKCELVHRDANIARRHAALAISLDGRVVAVDLKSTNGTHLNGRLIGRPTVMKPGDILYPGGIRVEMPHAPEPLHTARRDGCTTRARQPERP